MIADSRRFRPLLHRLADAVAGERQREAERFARDEAPVRGRGTAPGEASAQGSRP
jgi:hypothetical protein